MVIEKKSDRLNTVTSIIYSSKALQDTVLSFPLQSRIELQNTGIYTPILSTKWTQQNGKAQSNSHNRLTLQVYKYTKEIPPLTDSTAKEAE